MPINFFRIVLGLLLMFVVYNTNAGLSSRKFIDPSRKNVSEKIVNYINNAEKVYMNNCDSAFLNAYLALNIAIQQKHPEEIVFVNSYLAKYYAYNNQNVKAFNLLQKALDAARKNKLEELEYYCLLNLGITAAKQMAFSQSVKYYKEAEKIAIKSRNYIFMFRVKEAYGLNYLVIGNNNYKLSAAYFFEAYSIAKENNDRYLMAIANKHRAAVKMKTNYFDESIVLLKNEIAYFKTINDFDEIGDCQAYIGDCYYYQKKADSSMHYYQEAYKAKQISNSKDEMAILSTDIAYMYADKGRMDMFEKFSKESLEIIESTKNYKAKEYVYRWLSELYTKLGNYKEALRMHIAHEIVNDTIKNAKQLEEFAKVSTEKEYELKIEKEKAEHEKKLLKEKIETEHSNRVKKFFMLAFAIALFFVFVIFREYRIKRKQKSIIENQKAEVESQKSIIEKKNIEITDSINYARRIQEAVLQTPASIKLVFTDSFVLFQPKDIVSGDFYWVNKSENYTLLVVADCTGHGVPGGFMNMLCMGLVHEIVKERQINEPSKILEELRNKIILALRQQGEQGENKDGMDISICKIDNQNQLFFAGANNGILIVQNGNPIYLNADKMPVGYSHRMELFKTQKIQLNKGDCLYAYTDGFADQFGGPRGKKFMYKRLNELLGDISKYAMEEQHVILKNEFDVWVKTVSFNGEPKVFDQTDDICMIGIRI